MRLGTSPTGTVAMSLMLSVSMTDTDLAAAEFNGLAVSHGLAVKYRVDR